MTPCARIGAEAREPGPDRTLVEERFPATVALPSLPSFYAIVDQVTGGSIRPMRIGWRRPAGGSSGARVRGLGRPLTAMEDIQVERSNRRS